MADDIRLNISAQFESEGGDQFKQTADEVNEALLETAAAAEAADRALREQYSLAAEETAKNTAQSVTALGELQTVMSDVIATAQQGGDVSKFGDSLSEAIGRAEGAGVSSSVLEPAHEFGAVLSKPDAVSSDSLLDSLESLADSVNSRQPVPEQSPVDLFDTTLQTLESAPVETPDALFGQLEGNARRAIDLLPEDDKANAESALVEALERHREALEDNRNATDANTQAAKDGTGGGGLALPVDATERAQGMGQNLQGIGEELAGMGMGNIGRLGQAGSLIGRFAKFAGPAGMALTAGAAVAGTAKAGTDFLGRNADQGRDLATAYHTLDRNLGLRGESMMAAANGFNPDESRFGVANRFADMNATITDVGRFGSIYDSVASQAEEGYDPTPQQVVHSDGTVVQDMRPESERRREFEIQNRESTREMRLMNDVETGIGLARATGADEGAIAQLMQRGNRSGTFTSGESDAFGKVVFEAVRSGTRDGVSSSETFAAMEGYLGDMAARGIEGSVEGLANMALIQEQLRETGSKTLAGEQGQRASQGVIGAMTAEGGQAEAMAMRFLSDISGEDVGLEGNQLETFNQMTTQQRTRYLLEQGQSGNSTVMNALSQGYADTFEDPAMQQQVLTEMLGLSSTQALALQADGGGFNAFATDDEDVNRYLTADVTRDDVGGGAESVTQDMARDAERKDFATEQLDAFKGLVTATQDVDIAMRDLSAEIQGGLLGRMSSRLQDSAYVTNESQIDGAVIDTRASVFSETLGRQSGTLEGARQPRVEDFAHVLTETLDSQSDTSYDAQGFNPSLGNTYGALPLTGESLSALDLTEHEFSQLDYEGQRDAVRSHLTGQLETLQSDYGDLPTTEALSRAMGSVYGQSLDTPTSEYPEELREWIQSLSVSNVQDSFEHGFNDQRTAVGMHALEPQQMPINHTLGEFNDYSLDDYGGSYQDFQRKQNESQGNGAGGFLGGLFGMASAAPAPANTPQQRGIDTSMYMPQDASNTQSPREQADMIGEAIAEPIDELTDALDETLEPSNNITMTPLPTPEPETPEPAKKSFGDSPVSAPVNVSSGSSTFTPAPSSSTPSRASSPQPTQRTTASPQPQSAPPQASPPQASPTPSTPQSAPSDSSSGLANIDPTQYEYGSAEFFVASALKAEAEGAVINPVGAAGQAILESGWGKSDLAQRAQNFFGIKTGSSWEGPAIDMETSEYTEAGEHYRTDASWRAYDNPSESFKDYGELMTLDRYQGAEDAVRNGLSTREYLQGVKDGGYATDPNYVSKVMGVVESRDLEGIAARMREQYSGGGSSTPSATPQNASQPTPEPASEPQGTTYTVRSGDTLSAIASRHGTTVDALASANGISDPSRISVGQSLHIGPNPYRSTAARLRTEDGADIIRGASDENLGNGYVSNTDRDLLDRWMGLLTTSSDTNNPLTQEFGTSRFIREENGARFYGRFGGRHPGVDYDFGDYAEITAPFNGIAEVTKSNASTGYGNRVKLHGASGESMLFGHLHEVSVEDGDEITAGQVIGIQGNTGAGTGSHLHYEWRDAEGNYRDPNKMLAQRDERLEQGLIEDGQFYTGGYTGAGGKYEVAGTVHKGEYVIRSEQTDKYRDLLEAINQGNISEDDTTEYTPAQASILESAFTSTESPANVSQGQQQGMNINVTFGGALTVTGRDGEGRDVDVPDYMRESLERFAKERISPFGQQGRRSG